MGLWRDHASRPWTPMHKKAPPPHVLCDGDDGVVALELAAAGLLPSWFFASVQAAGPAIVCAKLRVCKRGTTRGLPATEP